MFFRGYSPAAGAYDEEYLQSFLRTQRQLAQAGIFTVARLPPGPTRSARTAGRGFPDWFLIDDGLPERRASRFPQGYFANPALNRAYDNLWANAPAPDRRRRPPGPLRRGLGRVAAEFADEERLLGYDIFNEPWPGTRWPACASPAGVPARRLRPDRAHRVLEQDDRRDPRRPTRATSPSTSRTSSSTSAPPPATARSTTRTPASPSTTTASARRPGCRAVPDPIGACENVGETLVFQNAEAHAERDRRGAAHDRVRRHGERGDPRAGRRARRPLHGLLDRLGVHGLDRPDQEGGREAADRRQPAGRAARRRQPRLPRASSPARRRSFAYDEGAGTFALVYSPRAAAATESPVGDPGAAPAALPRRLGDGGLRPPRRLPGRLRGRGRRRRRYAQRARRRGARRSPPARGPSGSRSASQRASARRRAARARRRRAATASSRSAARRARDVLRGTSCERAHRRRPRRRPAGRPRRPRLPLWRPRRRTGSRRGRRRARTASNCGGGRAATVPASTPSEPIDGCERVRGPLTKVPGDSRTWPPTGASSHA